MTLINPTTALELLARLEAGYYKHLEVRDRKLLDGDPRTIKTLEQYEIFELGMRATIADARRALHLSTEGWDE